MRILGVICWVRGHNWRMVRSCTRKCWLCGREETLYHKRFPKIGEPSAEWGPQQMLEDDGPLP